MFGVRVGAAATALVLVIGASSVAVFRPSESAAANAAPAATAASVSLVAPATLRAWRHSSHGVKIRWAAVSGASGYQVLQQRPSGKYVVLVSTSARQTVVKKLRTDKLYRFKVRATRKVAGELQVGATSMWVSAKTWKKGSKYRNTQSWHGSQVKHASIKLGQTGQSYIDLYVTGKGKRKAVSTSLRYVSLDRSIVTVDKNGVVTTTMRPGVARIRIVTHNGSYRVVKVRNINAASGDKSSMSDQTAAVNYTWTHYRRQLGKLAEWALTHYPSNDKTWTYKLNSAGELSVSSGATSLPDSLKVQLLEILNQPTYPTVMKINAYSIAFEFKEPIPELDNKLHTTGLGYVFGNTEWGTDSDDV